MCDVAGTLHHNLVLSVWSRLAFVFISFPTLLLAASQLSPFDIRLKRLPSFGITRIRLMLMSTKNPAYFYFASLTLAVFFLSNLPSLLVNHFSPQCS